MPPTPEAKPVFEAVVTHGYSWKSLTEIMSNEEITLNITKKGITIGHENVPLASTSTEVTIIAFCKKSNFEKFRLDEPLAVSFKTGEHNSFVKTIKKKSSLKLSIIPKETSSTTMSSALSSKRVFIFKLTTSDIKTGKNRTNFKFTCYQTDMSSWEGPPKDSFFFPVSLEASSFSQIKAFNQQTRKVQVTIQKFPSEYISFSVRPGTSQSLEKEFGDCMDTYPYLETDDLGNKWCTDCEEYLEDCWCGCEICDDYRGACECICPCGSEELFRECGCDPNPYSIMTRTYPLAAVLKLTKIAGPDLMLKFYEPKNGQGSLKIEFPAMCEKSVLGKVEVLVRSTVDLQEADSKKKKITNK